MKRIIIYIIFVCILLFFLMKNSYYPQDIPLLEQAIPIREDRKITGLFYTIQIDKKMNKKSLTISSRILDSINHYTDIHDMDSFFVKLKLKNNSPYPYLLKRIYIVDLLTNTLVDSISYKKEDSLISFYINSNVFLKNYTNYCIQIDLEK